MSLRRLTLPAVLVVTQLAAAGCGSSSPSDGGTTDVAQQDAACGPEVLADGGVRCVGPNTGEEFCVGPLSTCRVVDGSATPECCELVG